MAVCEGKEVEGEMCGVKSTHFEAGTVSSHRQSTHHLQPLPLQLVNKSLMWN